MCGICGIFHPAGLRAKEAYAACVRMTRAMAYRGPDEEGFYQNERVVLGHRRLSIIDLSSGRQPMADAKSDAIIVFNGEIYNFRELRSELADYPFVTKSDTEVILAGWRKWGGRVVDKLRGMFALAIYDHTANKIFAARDPLGKKPFYYCVRNGHFYFASDLRSLAASENLSGEISEASLRYYFTLGYIPAPLSIYEGVYKLEAGHTLEFDSGGLNVRPYWDIDLSVENREPETLMAERLGELVEKSVARRLTADVPVGALLSGGIDSNLVVSAMARQSTGGVRTFTAGFDGAGDERLMAASAARHYGVSHENVFVPDEFDLAELMPYLGEPLADSSIISTFAVCRALRPHLKCALTGDGGDEPFGGYTYRYLPHLWEERVRGIIPAAVCSLLGKCWPTSGNLPRILRLSTFFRNLAVSREKAFFLDQALRVTPEIPLIPEILAGREEVFHRMETLYRKGLNRDELTRMLYVDAKLYMTENVLVKVDRMSMANSVELRSPLLDTEIVEFAFSLPSLMKIRGRQCKYLLKKLAKEYVYPGILNLPKTGFSVPVESYLRHRWRADFEDRVLRKDSPVAEFLDHVKLNAAWRRFLEGDNVHSGFFFSIYVLALWYSGFHQRQRFGG